MKPVLYLLFFLFTAGGYAQFVPDINPFINVNGLAIKPERTISFSTDEGTNMHVDVSPDGRKILFTLLGDIYCIPTSGGVASQVTRGMAINDYPVWSPDGKNIAYLSDASGMASLHVMDTSGKSGRIIARPKAPFSHVKFSEPKWSPDGLCVSSGNTFYHLTGGSVEIPDSLGRIIGFSRDNLYMYCINYLENGWKIMRYNRLFFGDGTELYTRSCRNYCELINARVSPDGRWLTYITGADRKPMDSLMICDLTSGSERLLTLLNIKYPGRFCYQHYSFGPDSKTLFIAYGGKIHKIDINSRRNEIIPFTANVNVDMGALRYHTFKVSHDSFDVKYIRSARISPNGKQLVFAALNRIYIKELPDGTPRKLNDQRFGQFHPHWSPDGKWIVYTTWNDTVGGHVWRIPSNGGKPKQITQVPGLYDHPCWSPDGKFIVVTKGLKNDFDCEKGKIELIDVEMGSVQVIFENVPLPNCPQFSPDGQRIVFRPGPIDYDSEFLQKLVSVNVHDKSVKAIAYGKKESGNQRKQIQLSPDGRYIVFFRNENIYLVPVINNTQPVNIHDPGVQLPVIRLMENGIDPHWDNGGKTLGWCSAGEYFQVNPDKIISAAIKAAHEKKDLSRLMSNETLDVSVSADRTIPINLKSQSGHASGTIAFKNVRIITMNGDKVITNGCAVVRDGRFILVGENDKVTIPKGAEILDMKGKTIIPGLVDMHHHSSAENEIIPGQYWKYLAMLAYGVTTARDPSGSHERFAYSELTASGQMRGPRLYHVGNAVRSDYYFVTPLEAAVIADNRSKMNATVIKHYVQFARIQQQWLLMAGDRAGLNMTNEGSYYFLDEISMLKDGCAGVEHNPDWGETYKDVIMLFAKSGTSLTPALQTSYSRAFEEHPKYYFRQRYLQNPDEKYLRFTDDKYVGYMVASLSETSKIIDTTKPNFIPESKVDAAILKAGGRIMMGSHGEDQGIGAHFELWALQMGGMSNMEALRAATISGAEGLGIQKDVGSIEVGKIADMLILDKNPLEDIHNSTSIKYVIKDGVVYEGNSLDMVWPFKQKLPGWKINNASK